MSYTQPGAYLKGALLNTFRMLATNGTGSNVWFFDIGTAGQLPVSISYALGIVQPDGTSIEIPITTNGTTFTDVINLTVQRLSAFGATTVIGQSATSASFSVTGSTNFNYVHRILPIGTVRVSGRPGSGSTSAAGQCLIPQGLIAGTGYIAPITGAVPVTAASARLATAEVTEVPKDKKETKALLTAPDLTNTVAKNFLGVIVGIDRCNCCLKLLRSGVVAVILESPIAGVPGAGNTAYLFVNESTGKFLVSLGANGTAAPVGFGPGYEHLGIIGIVNYSAGDLTAVISI
jgi:hypothetical protein